MKITRLHEQGQEDDSIGSADELASAMNDEWSSQNEFTPEEWAEDQDGVWVEAVVAEYMDKMNMPQEWGTTSPPMDTMREEALNKFLAME
jgi:hypothetical protein